MTELRWFDINPPRELELDELTAVLRPLATRPRPGILAALPIVVFELWGQGGLVSWRVGASPRIAHDLTSHLTAHLPRAGVANARENNRPSLSLAADVHMRGWSGMLRTDMAASVSAALHTALRHTRHGEVAIVQWIIGPAQGRKQPMKGLDLLEALGLREAKEPDASALKMWRDKASEPIFACRGRVGAFASTPERAVHIVRTLGDGLRLANSASTGLRLSRANTSTARMLEGVTTKRFAWSAILSATEVACLLGWPVETTELGDLPVVGGHISRVPSALLVPGGTDEVQGKRVIGESLHPAQRGELVTVPVHTSLHHLHAIGPTGSGKSTLLTQIVCGDIAAGHSVLVIEPKGDLVTDILARTPSHRARDVVIIEPGAGRSIGFNVLAGERADAERRADQFVNLLSELHGGSIGPRSTDIALHAFIAISRLPGGTLCDIPILLTRPAFRRQVLSRVSDPLTLAPFFGWFDGLSDAERSLVVAPLLNKIRAFISRDALRRMLGQAHPKFDLNELFTGNHRRIVLVNLNRGLLGPETAALLGSLILNQAWAAIQRRTSLPAGARHPVMVTIDEVQDFLHLPGVDLGDFFAQCRGLGVALTVAHQHLAQLNPAQKAAILANARSRITFRPAPGDAKPLAAAFGSSLTAEDLLRLRAYEATCQLLADNQMTAPFSVRTLPLPPFVSDPTHLRQASAERYGVDGKELDAALTKRWQDTSSAHESPIGIRRRRSS